MRERPEQGLRSSPFHMRSYAGDAKARRRLIGNDIDSLRWWSSLIHGVTARQEERCNHSTVVCDL